MFRKDINGLRSIAALLVVFYHFKLFPFGGGYIGVDIFFVISGYLMNEICAKALHNKNWVFSFYKKRINRIYPALLFTSSVTVFFAILILPPSFLTDIKNQFFSALTFTSNIYYWRATSGYFSSIAESYLLLHTWSLGVEFQFYLLFPLAIYIANSKFWGRRTYLFYGVLFALSLCLCLLIVKEKPSAAFYLLPTRAWELFLGAFASALIYKNPLAKLTQYCSLGTILLFCIIAKDNLSWPSLYTVIPVVATALLLHARVSNDESILKFNFFQRLGSASYSIYLVHWPIASLVYNFGYELTFASRVFLSLSSIFLGILSHNLVEKRCKEINIRGVITTMLLAGFCFLSYKFQISRLWTAPDILAMDIFNRNYENTEAGTRQFGSAPYSCFYTGKDGESFDIKNCMARSDSKDNILLLGDSHMADMSLAFKEAFHEHNIMQATLSACSMIPGMTRTKNCSEFTDLIYNKLKGEKISYIFISAYWADQKNINDLPVKIQQAVQLLKRETKAKVYIIGQTKVFEMGLPRTIQLMKAENINKYRDVRVDYINKKLNSSLDKLNIPYINIYDMGCEDKCELISKGGVPMLFDTDHLTHEWAEYAVQIIKNNMH